MATAQVVASLKHDNTVYNIGDEIEAEKPVLDGLAEAGVVEKVKETPTPAPAPKQEPAPAKVEAEKPKKAVQSK